MDLSLDESRSILERTLREFFDRECPATLVRECETSGFSPELWRRFAELGAPAMGLPEQAGGLGQDLLDLCLVAQAAGRVLAPLPFADVATCGRLLAELDVNHPALPGIANGDKLFSLCPADAGPQAAVLAWGSVADSVLVYEQDTLMLLETDNVAPINLHNVGSSATALWPLAGDRSARTLCSGEQALSLYQTARAEWKLLTAASLVGLAQQALQIGVDYAVGREQFGSPIGSYQAIAHPLADCATRVDGAELLVWESAWARHADPSRFEMLCSMALLFAAETAQQTASASLHTHGGYGFSEEYDIQLYYRRAFAWAMAGGSIADEMEALATLRYGAAGG